MEIHNLMEELITSVVDEVCREDEAGANRYCTKPACRVDAACYVLNRVPPRYVSSGRGLAHLTDELRADTQAIVDVLRLVHEGLARVTSISRTFYEDGDTEHALGPVFNFPTISGRILDGEGFMPLSAAEVALWHGDSLMPMFDARWQNPYRIADQTPGTFLFWPNCVPADAPGVERQFDLEIRVAHEAYDPVNHLFSITVTSEKRTADIFSLDRDHHLPDLYAFRA